MTAAAIFEGKVVSVLTGVLRSSVCLIAAVMVLVACDSRQPEGTAQPRSSASASPTEPSSTASRQPNILLILTDDQAFTDMRAMPKTQSLLSRSGTVFRRAFASYPLCCPARVTLLTGQLAHNHGVLGNELPWGGATFFKDRDTLPVWLQRAGYNTIFLGKYLNGYPIDGDDTYIPPGWDEWHAPVERLYDYMLYQVNDNGVLNWHSGYQADYVERNTSRLIRKYAGKEAPFFMWAGFLAPHVGRPIESDDPPQPGGLDSPAVSDEYRNSMRGLSIPTKPSINERDLSDKGGPDAEPPLLPAGDLQEVYQQRLEALRSVDDAVAGILGTLRRTGELEETLVVFTSDNGYMVGEHRRLNKVLGYEESIHVPLIMAGPGVPSGTTANQIVSLTDLPATFLDVASASPGLPQDGISLMPLTRAPDVQAGRSLLLEAGGRPFPDVKRLYTGVRTADDKVLLRWWNGVEEVYDLKTDPYQLDGRLSPAEKEILPSLRSKLAHLADCVGQGCSSQ